MKQRIFIGSLAALAAATLLSADLAAQGGGGGGMTPAAIKEAESKPTPKRANGVPDFSGIFHCLDAQTGKVHWSYDMLSACWGSPMIVGDKVYIGDEDGDISIFNLSADPKLAMKEVQERNRTELVPINAQPDDRGRWEVVNMGSSVYSTPIVANGVLFISNKDQLFAIAEGAKPIVNVAGK